ncbi:MATE family efflux transporter [Streptomyces seoulensis]|uniref:MATE family efflux transporter n=1 Tax=Streptomyces seoulensis TaxID=73044 RepID=UPI0033B8BC3E
MSDRSAFMTIIRAAAPLYVTTLAASAGSLVDTALLGRHATVSLAAFAVTVAVFSPATATVAGALRGVMPFIAPYRGDPESVLPLVRSGMWLSFAVGGVCAATVAAVPLLGGVFGIPAGALTELGSFPWLLASSVLLIAFGQSATSVLVALGHSAQVMRSGLAATAASVALSALLVGGPGPLPGYGLTGAGLAMLASSLINAGLNQYALRHPMILAGRRIRPGRPDAAQILSLARVGLPLGGTVLVKFSVLGVLTFAAARLGTGSAAVRSVSESLVNVVFTAAVAVGQATVPPVAGYAEAGDAVRVRRVVRAGVLVALRGDGTRGSPACAARPAGGAVHEEPGAGEPGGQPAAVDPGRGDHRRSAGSGGFRAGGAQTYGAESGVDGRVVRVPRRGGGASG